MVCRVFRSYAVFFYISGRGRNNKDKCMFLLYLHANSVQNLKRGKKSSREEREDGASSEVAMDFTIKELYAIQEIQAQKNLFQLIVGLVIHIKGVLHPEVKINMFCALFQNYQLIFEKWYIQLI